MKSIYLVRKDSSEPYSESNWVIMNGKEFRVFIELKESEGRFFIKLYSCSKDDCKIVAECGEETYIKWRKENSRQYYIDKIKEKSGYTLISINDISDDMDDNNGEDTIVDETTEVTAEVIKRLEVEELHNAINKLSFEERKLILLIFLDQLPEIKVAEIYGVSQQAINKRKQIILKKIKKYLFSWL